MKAHKIELLVLDFEDYGIEEFKIALEQNNDYYFKVVDYQTRDIGEWYCDHPLNKHDTFMEYVDEHFG